MRRPLGLFLGFRRLSMSSDAGGPYLLLQTGFRITLEDGSGSLLLNG